VKRGFLLDLDGTLIDSNLAHLTAWHIALAELGHDIPPRRIAFEIGKGGDKLVPDLLGRDVEKREGNRLRTRQKKAFGILAGRHGLAPAPGAKALLAELRKRGIKTALATSSGDDTLGIAEHASGVKWRSLVDEVVGGSDVESSKPAPDIIEAAVEKLGLDADDCAMLGDTPWDSLAAKRGGVVSVGLTFGGNTVAALRRAGARQVYRDPADVLLHLDEVLAD